MLSQLRKGKQHFVDSHCYTRHLDWKNKTLEYNHLNKRKRKTKRLYTMSIFISKLGTVSKFISRNTFPTSPSVSHAVHLSSLDYWVLLYHLLIVSWWGDFLKIFCPVDFHHNFMLLSMKCCQNAALNVTRKVPI